MAQADLEAESNREAASNNKGIKVGEGVAEEEGVGGGEQDCPVHVNWRFMHEITIPNKKFCRSTNHKSFPYRFDISIPILARNRAYAATCPALSHGGPARAISSEQKTSLPPFTNPPAPGL